MAALLMIAGVTLDRLLGEPRRWHPLVGFGTCAQRMEFLLHPGENAGAVHTRWRGSLAVLLAVVPATALAAWTIESVPRVGVVLQVVLLYLTLGHRSLHQHALPVAAALGREDLPAARRLVGLIVSRDTAAMRPVDVARAAVESVLENGNDAVFGTLFWFALAGAPGALLYRLINTLDAMWGYRTPRYRFFGSVAARCDDVMNLIPARLTALTYALLGHFGDALRCWREQGKRWESPNAGPVMAAGAGSLHLRLGGPAFYHGHWKSRPPLGQGAEPQAQDIARALRLVARGVIIWIAAAIACSLSREALGP
ncbi:MAG TPA: adenosylcobinamide-phosphate synthase CbiB [Steroidobacteraceae bacterium]|jgi:adenosylcobinamide-phosphate synthase|nr:adenosylcobinamide-phosphate synthase CbiB [Steroidobacteraceae bacterium]